MKKQKLFMLFVAMACNLYFSKEAFAFRPSDFGQGAESQNGHDLSQNESVKLDCKDNGQDEQEKNCPICLEEIDLSKKEEIAFLDCLHKFHKECIKKWFSGKFKNECKCPTCRTVAENYIENEGLVSGERVFERPSAEGRSNSRYTFEPMLGERRPVLGTIPILGWFSMRNGMPAASLLPVNLIEAVRSLVSEPLRMGDQESNNQGSNVAEVSNNDSNLNEIEQSQEESNTQVFRSTTFVSSDSDMQNFVPNGPGFYAIEASNGQASIARIGDQEINNQGSNVAEGSNNGSSLNEDEQSHDKELVNGQSVMEDVE